MILFGLDLQQLLIHFGALTVFAVIFAESALIFFLPGDSFLFVAGVAASQGYLNLWEIMFLGLIGAVVGNNVGYWLGRRYGIRLFRHDKALLFQKSHVTKVEQYYDRYGPLTVILARFTPAIRTLAPIAAGIARMNYRTFFIYNITGALLWIISMTLAGFWLGNIVHNIDRYILPFVVAVVVLSVLPGVWSYWRERRKNRQR